MIWEWQATLLFSHQLKIYLEWDKDLGVFLCLFHNVKYSLSQALAMMNTFFCFSSCLSAFSWASSEVLNKRTQSAFSEVLYCPASPHLAFGDLLNISAEFFLASSSMRRSPLPISPWRGLDFIYLRLISCCIFV